MKAVIFDLDGTIVLSHPTHFAAYKQLFGEFGIVWSFEEFNEVFAGIGAPGIIETILWRHGIRDFDVAALVRKKRDIFNELLASQKMETVGGFFPFLEMIKGRGLKKTIASGSNRDNIGAMLRNIGVAADFPVFLSGEDVTSPKPAPDIFLAAAEKIGVEPSECLVLEDTTHGIRAAKSAGMRCIAFTTTHSGAEGARLLREAGADEVVADYTKIRLIEFSLCMVP